MVAIFRVDQLTFVRMANAVLILCLFLAACAPARLQRVAVRSQPSTTAATDLARAFGGATDAAAKRSLGKWIEKNHTSHPPESPPGFRVTFHPGGPGIFAPCYFDRLEPAEHYDVRGLNHHREAGIGVPMIGFRENRGREPVEKWYPPEGITRVVTAVAVPGPAGRVEIRLMDRMHTGTVLIAGKRQPLAADFTVPFTRLLEKTGPLLAAGFTSTVRAKADREAGFVLMESYDPDRTPLILIHGLFSTPLAWAELTNDLWSEPEVRQRYQIWHYLYPTNPPALYSARVMRGKLDELRGFLDPGGNDPAMRRSVVIGHSMGGLLAKSLAVEPRDAFWDAVFTRPFDSLDLTPAQRRTLGEAFFWKPRGNVDRVVFCSVPFRGSRIASSWIGKLGSAIIAPSSEFQDFFREIERKNPGVIQPDYAELTWGKVTSVKTLSPGQRSMKIFDQLPLVGGTAAHVITGSMDHVVQRSSATLSGAESILEVPAGHGSFHHPKAVAEIIRILKLPPAR
jgi:pimeloyl-ACP methyl ester carboxylesterase